MSGRKLPSITPPARKMSLKLNGQVEKFALPKLRNGIEFVSLLHLGVQYFIMWREVDRWSVSVTRPPRRPCPAFIDFLCALSISFVRTYAPARGARPPPSLGHKSFDFVSVAYICRIYLFANTMMTYRQINLKTAAIYNYTHFLKVTFIKNRVIKYFIGIFTSIKT